jgi:glucosyl-3-phosphoglycerate synthase
MVKGEARSQRPATNKDRGRLPSPFMTESRSNPVTEPGNGSSVSVCLPALNVESTIAEICMSIQGSLMPAVVDELIVIDSGSRDATPARAAAAGADVYHVDDIAPRVDGGGKGEALWKSVAVARGDIIVWIDSDIHNFTPQFVSRLVNPLLASPGLVMTKAYYRRPLQRDAISQDDDGGGRVTEIALRPLVNLLCPELAAVIQPLSGEYAIRRQVAFDLPFFSGYGVDIGLLVDVVREHGLSAVHQVDLGTRVHTNRSLHALGRTSFEVMTAFFTCMADQGRLSLEAPLGDTLRQFDVSNQPSDAHSDVVQLPPWRSARGGFVGTQMATSRLAAAPH